ncbi:hypothetical protein PybrP1_000279 [[Pythium] brassicae (nom. inval.)]|nr:hypothetical protein PybrP1_000279 [[Pythium] brassicae (nom. inval.)]
MASHRDEAATAGASRGSLEKTEQKTKTKPAKKKQQQQEAPAGGRGTGGGLVNTGDTRAIHTLVVKPRATDTAQHSELKHAALSRVVVPTVGESEQAGVRTDGYATGVYRILLESRRAELLCESVMLRYNHVAHLRQLFDAEDTLRTGEITQDEFFTIINEDKRKLTQGIFEFVGLAKHVRRLTFDDFVVCAVTFAALSRPELLHYAFTLFDQDASGAMDERELVAFCGDLKNKGFFFERNVQIAQKKLVGGQHGRALNDGLVDFQDIASGSAQFPAAFYPILQFQRNIRVAILGEPFWEKAGERQQRIEGLVHYMRLNEGHLPPLTIADYVKALFSREMYGLRKLAVVKFAEEKRLWELEREKAAATNALPSVNSAEESGRQT